MKLPSIKQVETELKFLAEEMKRFFDRDEELLDVRLQVYPDEEWHIRWGDPSYDMDHQGYWGSSEISVSDVNFQEIADELIKQVEEDFEWQKKFKFFLTRENYENQKNYEHCIK